MVEILLMHANSFTGRVCSPFSFEGKNVNKFYLYNNVIILY